MTIEIRSLCSCDDKLRIFLLRDWRIWNWSNKWQKGGKLCPFLLSLMLLRAAIIDPWWSVMIVDGNLTTFLKKVKSWIKSSIFSVSMKANPQITGLQSSINTEKTPSYHFFSKVLPLRSVISAEALTTL